uniref:DNA-directed RNA polymerase subunit beta n=1 Tax=Cycas revoluta TaxID=3396 RepID=A0A0C4W275_CYCRE|nr:DNA-directed RNA polymerase IV second largest subunit [Cycas revoluta]
MESFSGGSQMGQRNMDKLDDLEETEDSAMNVDVNAEETDKFIINLDEINNAEEIENCKKSWEGRDNTEGIEVCTKEMDLMDIADEIEDSGSKDDVVFIVEETEDSGTNRDVEEIAEGRCNVVAVRDDTEDNASDMDAERTEQHLRSMAVIDSAEKTEKHVSSVDMVDIQEGTEDSAREQDIMEKIEGEFSEKELHNFCRDTSKAFFIQWGLISHQLNSFNDFMSNGLQQVVDDIGGFVVEPDYNPQKQKADGLWRHASISFGKVTVEKPSYCTVKGKKLQLKPTEARLRNMTYSAPVYVEMKMKIYTRDNGKTNGKCKNNSSLPVKGGENVMVLHEENNNVLIGRIPVMVKSELCHMHGLAPKDLLKKGDCYFDVGGYFIIKGHEKIFIAQEERCTSRIWVSSKPSWMVTYTPKCRISQYKHKVVVKLSETPKDDKWCPGRLVLSVNFLSVTIPVVIMFFALGLLSDWEMMQMVCNGMDDSEMMELLLSSINKSEAELKDFRCRNKSLEYIGTQMKNSKFPKKETPEEAINAYLFTSISGHKQKAMFLGYMINCLLLCYFERRQVESKDDFKNKRLELAGELLSRELGVLLRQFRNRMSRGIQRELSGRQDLKPMDCYIDASIITNGLVRAFSTGNWSHPIKFNTKCTGIVASVKQTNPLQTVSEMRKMRLKVQYAAKLGDARYQNPSYWGRVCFISTPDGENCGLVKNLAVTGLVSLHSAEEPILNILNQCGIKKLDQISLSNLKGMTKIFINGEWVGAYDDPSFLVNKLRDLRRRQHIHPQVEIKRDHNQNEVRIFSDAGRILRPLFIVKDQRLCISKQQIQKFKKSGKPFKYLMEKGVVEILGVEEEEDTQIAGGVDILFKAENDPSYPRFTHCELDASFILSLNAGLIPFANRNLSTRVLYQSEKHSKQAIGYYSTNPRVRCETSAHQLFYPQKPLFKTMSSECLNKVHFYNGQNAVVAVNVHYGYNQEDSLIANHASIDRGLFRSMHFHTFTSETDHCESDSVKSSSFRLEVDFGKPQTGNLRVDKLDDDGLPQIAANLLSGDTLIGKVGPQPSDVNFSLKLKHTEKGRVDQVIMSTNDDGKKIARVCLREVRYPSLGDKFSSMHGQKGVVGFVEEQENMPFTQGGIVPDLIINPHAFPSRQTPGQLFECALGKVIASSGVVGDATPFRPMSVSYITEQLHRCGYEQWGKEQMYNGRTGYKMQSKIFIGPTYYQRLIHMAEDKMKYRNHGPVHPLTRQPVADRKRHGGVKFGEMERDCMLAHGATANLMERLFYLSDFYSMHICRGCRMVATVILRNGIRGPYCPFCKTVKHIVKVNVPYACKLLYQELFSMGICLRFSTELC